MKAYDIIVLDTGTEINHEALIGYQDIDCKYFIDNNEEVITDKTDITGHGTAVTWLIKQQLPTASILSLRIFDIVNGEAVCSESRLINALNFIDRNYKTKVINLSSSISAPKRMKELKEITKRLSEKGIVLVSPHHNNHSLTYPASFKWVIGVSIDSQRTRGKEKILTNDSVINIIDTIKQYQVPWKDNQYDLKTGASFSCPEVSAIACTYINAGAKNVHEVLECFKNIFDFRAYPFFRIAKPDFVIKKAVAFPFNKEIHSVLRFSQELTFELIDIYDIRHSLNVGCSTKDLLSDNNIPEYTIKNIDNISWDNFDTLILGCVQDLFSVFKDSSYLKKIINLAIKNNKNIYSFENLYNFLDIDDYKGRLFCPVVGKENFIPSRGGRLSKTSVAVVGIFGTSSKQGKFTLQLDLRKELKKQGYKIGQIGTEPSALLFGIDYIFPMGYHGTVYLKEEEKVMYCNNLIRKLSESCPDIIIVGSQRETIPQNFENIYQLCTNTYAFIQGTKPDYAIVMLSINDEDDYILRTINFLYSITQTKTIAFVLSPVANPQKGTFKTSKTEYSIFKRHIEETFNIPVFLLGEYNLANNLIETVIKNL